MGRAARSESRRGPARRTPLRHLPRRVAGPFTRGRRLIRRRRPISSGCPSTPSCARSWTTRASRRRSQHSPDPPVEFTRLDGAEGGEPGIQFDAWIMKPPAFDSTKRYPVLFTVYGGPAEATVLDQWDSFTYLFHTMLARGRLYRCQRRQSRHASASRPGVAQSDLQTHRHCRHRGSDGRGTGVDAAHLCRRHPRGRVGVEQRRHDDAQPALPVAEGVRHGDGRRASHRSALLRHDLHRTVHGAAAGQRGRVSPGLADDVRGQSARSTCYSSTAPATTTCTTRIRKRSSTRSSRPTSNSR